MPTGEKGKYHKVDAEGLHPVESKVKAIVEAPTPTTVTELKAYVGLLNYYNRFTPNLTTRLAPLHYLLIKDVQWVRNREREEAFQESKLVLQYAKVLDHYSADKELLPSRDASLYGVGIVMSHVMKDGREPPLGFMYTHSCWETLFATWQRGIGNNVRDQAIPLVPLWKDIHNLHRPQAFDLSVSWEESGPSDGIPQDAEVGGPVESI